MARITGPSSCHGWHTWRPVIRVTRDTRYGPSRGPAAIPLLGACLASPEYAPRSAAALLIAGLADTNGIARALHKAGTVAPLATTCPPPPLWSDCCGQ